MVVLCKLGSVLCKQGGVSWGQGSVLCKLGNVLSGLGGVLCKLGGVLWGLGRVFGGSEEASEINSSHAACGASDLGNSIRDLPGARDVKFVIPHGQPATCDLTVSTAARRYTLYDIL